VATTLIYKVVCPHCGYEGEVEVDELAFGCKCLECDEPLGTVYRVEGFRLVKLKDTKD
jgi:hypothetical protein